MSNFHKFHRMNTKEYQEEIKNIQNNLSSDRRMLSDSFAEESSLEKGLKGDWKKEGYTIYSSDLNVSDSDAWNSLKELVKNGFKGGVYYDTQDQKDVWHQFNNEESVEKVKNLIQNGKAKFSGMGKFIYAKDLSNNPVGGLINDTNEVLNNWVKEDHRRKGISTQMHLAAEKHHGKLGSGSLSEEGKLLWSQPNRPFGKEELDKGLKGDWGREGYVLKYHGINSRDFSSKTSKTPEWETHLVTAHLPSGEEVGRYEFVHHHEKPYKNKLFSNVVNTHKDHKRKGLANAAYNLIENKLGIVLEKPVGENLQTEDSKALWSQPSRPFGKEELEKMSKGFAEIYELLAKAKLKK
jgi:hypothetical protein